MRMGHVEWSSAAAVDGDEKQHNLRGNRITNTEQEEAFEMVTGSGQEERPSLLEGKTERERMNDWTDGLN